MSAFPGVKVVNLVDFPFFPDRKVVLSVGLRSPAELNGDLSEAEIRDACMAEAREAILQYESGAEWFQVKRDVEDAVVSRLDGNQSFPNLNRKNFLNGPEH